MPIEADDYADLVASTLRDLRRHKWTDLTTDIQDHVAARKLLKKEKVQFQSGRGINLNIMTDHSNAAENAGLYDEDTLAIPNVLDSGFVPWRHTKVPWGWDEREIAMNRRPAEILDMVKVKRSAALISMVALIEKNFWSKPTDSTDKVTPFGIQYWIVTNASKGFNGGDPAGFSAGAGNLATATYPRWKNFTAQYAAISRADLVGKMREATYKTSWLTPIDDIPTDQRSGGFRRVIYAPYSVVEGFNNYAEDQNENLGKDVASMDGGKVIFRGNPIVYVPSLDAKSDNPVYMVDWNVFYFVCLSGFYMKETGPLRSPRQHLVHEVWQDLTWNTRCTDRRKLSVFSTS